MMKIHCLYDKIIPIDELKLNPKNRNIHPENQIKRLAQILTYQGFRFPVKVSNLSGMVVSGHGRVEAARLNGWTEVPVNFQDYESPAQEYADSIADNSIASWAELDIPGIQLEAPDLGPDFNLDLLGIKDFSIITPTKIGLCDENALPDSASVPARSVLGDVYILGNHRLMCGDCTVGDSVEKLMDGQKADMVFTDPPYNIAEKTKGIASQAPTNKQNKKLMDSDWDKGFDFELVQASIYSTLSENCTVYVCTSSFVAPKIWEWMEKCFDFSGYCVWSKPNPFPSLMKRRWAFSSELVCYATNGKQIFHYPESGNALSVWTIPIGEGGLHPTQKPVKVSEHAITHSSNAGHNVVDLFGGSGSTLIACEKTNRKCFMMELDKHYCDVIVSRWLKYTGNTKVIRNGEEINW